MMDLSFREITVSLITLSAHTHLCLPQFRLFSVTQLRLLRSSQYLSIDCGQDTADLVVGGPVAQASVDANQRDCLKSVLMNLLTNRSGLLEDAARIKETSKNSFEQLGSRVDALLADCAAGLWTSLDEGLQNWRVVVGNQQEKLLILNRDTR